MVATMARQPKRKVEKGQKYPQQIDVFSRMDGNIVQKLDELADAQHRSRSGMVAWLVEQFVLEEHPKLLARRGASRG